MLFRSKQKTAYEILSSDWSSDVCSSDLTGRYYVTHTGGAQLWKIMPPLPKLPMHERPQAIVKGETVRMCNDLHDFDWALLDRDYYARAAWDLVLSTGG